MHVQEIFCLTARKNGLYTIRCGLSRRSTMSIRNKLFITYLVASIFPIIILTSVSYSVTRGVIYRNAQRSTDVIIDQVGDDVNDLFGEAVDLAQTLATSPILTKAIEPNFSSEDAQFRLYREAGQELFDIARAREGYDEVYVIGENGSSFSSSEHFAAAADLRERYWYRRVLYSSFLPVTFSPHRGSLLGGADTESFISFGYPIVHEQSNARLGVVLVEIAEERVRELLTARLAPTGYLFVQYSRSGFTGSRDAAPDSTYLVSLANNQEIDAEVLARNRELVIIRDLAVRDFRLAAVVDLRSLMRDAHYIGFAMIGTTACSLLLAAFVAVALSRTISHPIRELQSLMREAEGGDLEIRMPVRSSDEVGELGNSFNAMLEKIRELMRSVYEEHIELRKAELKNLQALITPHFLYNTLDSIQWLSRRGENGEVVRLVAALTTLLRKGISGGDDFIPVESEIEHVRSYLDIQSVRYGSAFTYTIDVDGAADPLMVPKLVLQPIVENAIYHGIKEKRGPGTIEIRARKTPRILFFEVYDNGVGMDRGTLAALDNTIRNLDGERISSYGLKNVQERVRIFFGRDHGLRITSERGEGTTVVLTLPIITEVPQYGASAFSG